MTRRFQKIDRPLNIPTTGEAVGVPLAILAGIIVVLIAGFTLASIWPVRAHEAMAGWQYPISCCANYDCAEIGPERVKEAAGGYLVDGQFHVPHSEVKHSPDGRYHACFPKPDFLKCLFVPPNGS